jgi:hypothetical protein
MNIQVTLTGQELIDLVKNEIITVTEARAFLGFTLDLHALQHASGEHSHDHD